MPQISNFSDGYYLLDTELQEYGGDHAAAPRDMLAEVAHYTSSLPLFRAGDEHFYAKSEWGIPANTIAVPDEMDADGPVLLAKEQTAVDYVLNGGERPKTR